MKPDFEYYTITQLIERWTEYDITEKDLLQYGAEEQLEFVVRWDTLKKANCNLICSTNETWLDIPRDAMESLKQSDKIDLCKFVCTNKSDCNFEYPAEYLAEISSAAEESNLDKVFCYRSNLLCKQKDVVRFDEQFKDIPLYLNPDNEFYCEELAAAVTAWEAIYINREDIDNAKTYKQNIVVWLEESAFQLKGDASRNDNQIGRVATLISKHGSTKVKNINKQ